MHSRQTKTIYTKGGIMSEDTGRFLLLQKNIPNLYPEQIKKNFQPLAVNPLFKFSAQDSNLEYLFWRSKNLPVSSDIISPLTTYVHYRFSFLILLKSLAYPDELLWYLN